MKFGVCSPSCHSPELAEAGWDFIEENVSTSFDGLLDDRQYQPPRAVLPILAANCLLPPSLPVTGPLVDLAALERYITKVICRCTAVDCRILVFGSGDSRSAPEGWDRSHALEQLIRFSRLSATIAAKHGVTIVLEHLGSSSCNMVNTLETALQIVTEVGHPNFQALLDTYHFWSEDLPLTQIEALLPHLRHVHVADLQGRAAPGESGRCDYRPIFRLLKNAGYQGAISVEAPGFTDFAEAGRRVLAFIKEQWAQA